MLSSPAAGAFAGTSRQGVSGAMGARSEGSTSALSKLSGGAALDRRVSANSMLAAGSPGTSGETSAAGGRVDAEPAVGIGVGMVDAFSGASAASLDDRPCAGNSGELDDRPRDTIVGMLLATPMRVAPLSLEPGVIDEGNGMRTEPDARLAGRGGRGGLPAGSSNAGDLSSPVVAAASVSLMLESAAIVRVSRDRPFK
jgi:hypothetical protein